MSTARSPGKPHRQQDKLSRRRFLKGLGLATPAAGAALAASLGLPQLLERRNALAALSPAETAAQRSGNLAQARATEAVAAGEADVAVRLRAQDVVPKPLPRSAASPKAAPVENVLLRMQEDLLRAIEKPVEERTWVMAIDLRKCIGCSACTIACKAENQLPPGVVYRPVIDIEVGEYPNVSRQFVPRPCMQCDDPPCVPVCPVGATYKRPDGIVEINYNRCIGCRYCIPACPYSARTFDFGEYYTDDTPARQAYEETYSPEYGRNWKRGENSSPVGNVRKCQFCLHRLNVGMLPACVTTCIGEATFFGDKSDPDSLINELINRPNVIRLKEELGTEPKVFYLL